MFSVDLRKRIMYTIRKSKIFLSGLIWPYIKGVKFPNKLLALHVPIYLRDAVNKKVLHKKSKLLLARKTFYLQMRVGEWNFTPLHMPVKVIR